MTFKVILTFICFLLISNSPTINDSINGTWIAEKDVKSKLVFKADNICKEYYDNILQNEYTYSVSDMTPQCGFNVPIDNYTSYLKLTNTKDDSDIYCYEINGLTTQKLSLRVVNRGGIIVYNRQ